MTKHGAPDWSKYRPESHTYPLEDLAEHAVRMGSIDTFDRRGDVLEMDDFEHGIVKWDYEGYGTGAIAKASPTHARSKGYSMEMIVGKSPGEGILATWRLPYPKLSKIGLELSFAMGTHLWRCYWAIEHYDGVNDHSFRILYNNVGKTLSYYDSTGGETTFATGVKLYNAPTLFNYLKVVIDLTEDKYTRVLVNEVEYDITSKAGYPIPSDAIPHIEMVIQCYGNRDTNLSSYVDDVIVTQDEP